VIADVLERPVCALAETETAALGASVQAAVVARAASHAELASIAETGSEPPDAPRADAVETYREVAARFRDLVRREHAPSETPVRATEEAARR
jgi:sugar (pentulose or hexulose) kinase